MHFSHENSNQCKRCGKGAIGYYVIGEPFEQLWLCSSCKIKYDINERKMALLRLDFRECPECASKPGMAQLCEVCLHNRRVVSNLRTHVITLEEKKDNVLKKLKKKLSNRRREVKNLLRAYEASISSRQLYFCRLSRHAERANRMRDAIDRAKKELENGKIKDTLYTLSNAKEY